MDIQATPTTKCTRHKPHVKEKNHKLSQPADSIFWVAPTQESDAHKTDKTLREPTTQSKVGRIRPLLANIRPVCLRLCVLAMKYSIYTVCNSVGIQLFFTILVLVENKKHERSAVCARIEMYLRKYHSINLCLNDVNQTWSSETTACTVLPWHLPCVFFRYRLLSRCCVGPFLSATVGDKL